jgi:hypothetical protein
MWQLERFRIESYNINKGKPVFGTVNVTVNKEL